MPLPGIGLNPTISDSARRSSIAIARIFSFFLLMSGGFELSAASVTLAWNASDSPGVVGYKIFYGVAEGVYTNAINAGNVTTVEIPDLVPGTTYYFAAIAVANTGAESLFSSSVAYSVPSERPPRDFFEISLNDQQQPVIRASAGPGLNYEVQCSTDFLTWTTLATVTASESGEMTYTDTTAWDTFRFYRLTYVAPQGPRLQITLNDQRQPVLTASADPGKTYQLECSADVNHWDTLATAVGSPEGEVAFVDASAVSVARRFYRLRDAGWVSVLSLTFDWERHPVLNANAIPGKSYELEYSKDLKSWKSLTFLTGSIAGTITYTDRTATAADRRFYRLREAGLATLLTISVGVYGCPVLKANAAPGQFYELQYSEDFVYWYPLATLAGSSDGTLEYMDIFALFVPQRFYRLQAL